MRGSDNPSWSILTTFVITLDIRCPCAVEISDFKLPWREAGPPNHLGDEADSDQLVIDTELSRSLTTGGRLW